MSVERSIHLDLGMPPKTDLEDQADSGTPTHKDSRSPAQLQQDRQAFEANLKGPPHQAAIPAAVPASPFALFGQTPVVQASVAQLDQPSAAAASEALAGLDATLSALASRVLVGQGRNGSTAVHIQLESHTLPGVSLEVFEAEGALVAQFVCTNEASRERLARAVDWLAKSLAQRLMRSVLVRVLADDPEDPSPVESRADAPI
ncbi:hypothetical protein E8K88_14635 [Lampropedia aestuarii]|uniref:Flagellar hook-length control protein FliK n=1 Tax=Lampropedia aestuarii TaxID=2562762 RepID=A0A4S5BP76_9BURK|nr:hypothetical protein [Lampropedia aestuarii]THJ31548.1 hypothetical protein E8K88_14635 [Lampropedia aestuarii]